MNDQAQFQTKQANGIKLHVIHEWKQVKNEHACKGSSQFETNFGKLELNACHSLHGIKLKE